MNLKMETTERSHMATHIPSLLGIVVGVSCNWLWPWRIASYRYVLPVGIVLVSVVVVLIVLLARSFKHHGTSSDPHKETTAIVDTGLFRFSRNPAYVSLAILHATIGVFLNNVWVLLMIIPAMIVVHYMVVLREEAYLEVKFGAEYLDYKSRVRRWL
jgi:protein-S-isoprenylcysteine O-methyltransferase Ste14